MTITPDTQTLANISGTVVLAGAGKMGSALLTGWLARGLDSKRVIVIEPYPSDDIRSLTAGGIRLNPAAEEIGAAAALVIAVKPQTFRRRRSSAAAAGGISDPCGVDHGGHDNCHARPRPAAATSSARCPIRLPRLAAA